MKSNWVYKKTDLELQETISRELNISPVIANLLINRGISNASDARKFISPLLKDLYDPFLMKDMEKSVDRIIRAITSQEKIMVYGDYDADGVTTTTLLLIDSKRATASMPAL